MQSFLGKLRRNYEYRLCRILYIQSISALFFLMTSALSPRILASFYPGHRKSSSPLMPLEDMEIISAVFAGSLIREGFGK
jgi:hypothetical protein